MAFIRECCAFRGVHGSSQVLRSKVLRRRVIPKPFCKIILYERDILYLKSSQSRASIRFSAATSPTTLSTNAFQHANKENARRALKSNFVGVAYTDEGQFELSRLTTPALEATRVSGWHCI